MKRFRRTMSRTGDSICIVLMVVTVVMFVRGGWVSDVVAFPHDVGQLDVGPQGGGL
jgi:hypothetical protein